MSGKLNISALHLLTMAALIVSPIGSQAVENCSQDKSQEGKAGCHLKSAIKTQPEIILDADRDFGTIPSCKSIDSLLDNFIASVKKMAKAVNKSSSSQPSILEQILPNARLDIAVATETKAISSSDIFNKRLAISPVAKQFYYNYLDSQEAAKGSFDRPVLNFQFDINANPEISESLNGLISPSVSSAYSYTNEFSPSVSVYYPFSFENLYSAKSLGKQELSEYYNFIDQSISDSLDTVYDFYDLKSNMLSTILNVFQYEASVDRVYRLKRLEQKGLSSRLDISRANVTKVSQETSLFNAKAALSQSYDRLAGGFLFPKDFESTIVPQLAQQGFGTACWNKPPSLSLEGALQANPSLVSLRHQIESSKFKRKSIIAQNFPELSVSVSYESVNQWGNINGSGITGDYNRTRDFVAAASFNWNIFDFGQTAANARSQRYVTDSLRSQLTDSLAQLETSLLANFSAYIASTRNIASLTKASEEATMNYINALKGSQIGVLNETDVDNIFNQLTSINNNLIANIKTRNTTAVAIAKIVQKDGFDRIEFNHFITNWRNSFSKSSSQD